jgi:hypothetical protein
LQSNPKYQLPAVVLRETFAELRRCGRGREECQVLWTSPWEKQEIIERVVHPRHIARGDGFILDGDWLNEFWQELARTRSGIRVQIHTHPGPAFHSVVDDEWPIIHSPGFLSLVIPRFATGAEDLSDAFLAELGEDGRWREASIAKHLEIEL